ncbi:hypothetical protein AVEN_26739-1 [Araneus ventricosus]|uniref:Uncharacterized protein n=1 Tax=Araneus ventricosus TaxID=182803 RepID=A0A4Y2H8P6_ARAVE|nr:hypothetical protein AVEN_26739-1 [Araneus ventricosus]
MNDDKIMRLLISAFEVSPHETILLPNPTVAAVSDDNINLSTLGVPGQNGCRRKRVFMRGGMKPNPPHNANQFQVGPSSERIPRTPLSSWLPLPGTSVNPLPSPKSSFTGSRPVTTSDEAKVSSVPFSKVKKPAFRRHQLSRDCYHDVDLFGRSHDKNDFLQILLSKVLSRCRHFVSWRNFPSEGCSNFHRGQCFPAKRPSSTLSEKCLEQGLKRKHIILFRNKEILMQHTQEFKTINHYLNKHIK